MRGKNEPEEVDMEMCQWVETRPDKELVWLLNSPSLSRDLLNHAGFCTKCRARIDAVTSSQFEELLPQDRNMFDAMAERFVKRNALNVTRFRAESKQRTIQRDVRSDELRVAAHQKTESAWPYEKQFDVDGKLITLRFTLSVGHLMVKYIGPRLERRVVVRSALSDQIALNPGDRGNLGLRKKYGISVESSDEEIRRALIDTSFRVAKE